MSKIRSLEEIAERVKNSQKRLVVAGGNAPSVIEAIGRAVKEKIVVATLVGDEREILKVARDHEIDPSSFDVCHEPDAHKVAPKAVELVVSGKADLLMKGLIGTADYMRAILNKKSGLVGEQGILTHVMVIEVPSYHKLLFVSDVAILVSPSLSEKLIMLEYCVQIAKALGITMPKAGIISCVEQPSTKIDSTIDGKLMKQLAGRSHIKGAVVDGPLAIDLAISKKSAEIKKFKSPVAGDCDILIFPDICTANVFFKSLTILAGARLAALVVGADVPCILTSRADTEESKFLSIALGALLA
ncbi:MAG: phosphate butyryltransferase [Candidatus Aminicenantes bacterium]|nr:phosphate butyryltransferase [Candidatus Aminicenantes bacterium]